MVIFLNSVIKRLDLLDFYDNHVYEKQMVYVPKGLISLELINFRKFYTFL